MRTFSCLAFLILALSPVRAGNYGTAFAITPDGYFVTCHHVVNGAERLLVHHGGRNLSGSIVHTDPRNDLAVVRVSPWTGDFLVIADSETVPLGSDVLAAGFPDPAVLGKNPKVSKGIVNARTGVQDDPRHFQVSVPLQPGNSGGPVFAPNGHVVGVVAAGLNSRDRFERGGYLPQSVNYAVKSNYLFPLLQDAGVALPSLEGRAAVADSIDFALRAIVLIEALAPGESAAAPPRPEPALMRPVPTAPVPVPPGTRPAPAPMAQIAPSFQPPVPVSPAATSVGAGPSGPWIFPHSDRRYLSPQELGALDREQLWRARNEIYLRHGYEFSTWKGKRFAREFGAAYRPTTRDSDAIQRSLNAFESANLQAILAAEQGR